MRWYRDGHWSSTGTCFDIGNATRAALERFERTGEPFPGDAAPDAAGNGPLMRLAPVVLAYASRPGEAIRFAGESARTTHGAPEAVDASRAFAALLLGALERDRSRRTPASDRCTRRSRRRSRPPASRQRSAAAGTSSTRSRPRCGRCARTDSFEDGVLAAVNLGDDADTTAAIYGQLAGAIHGLDGIPRKWREQVHAYDALVAFADALYDLDVARPAIARFEHIKPTRIVECATPQDVADALAPRRAVRDPRRRPRLHRRLVDHRPADRHARRCARSTIGDDTVTVGAGVRLGELYDALAPHGRTVAAGCGPTVGIAGLALGGGIGILGRLHGFTCDQVVGARRRSAQRRVVERRRGSAVGAQGRGRRALRRRHGAHPQDRRRRRRATAIHLALDDAEQALETWMHLDAPDELAASLLIIRGTAHVFGAHVGPATEAAELLAPFGGTPSSKSSLQRGQAPPGRDRPGRRRGPPAPPLRLLREPLAISHIDPAVEYDFSPLGGAYNRVAPDATALPHRDARFLLKVAGKDQDAVDRALPDGSTGVYVNFPEPDRDPWDAAYLGANRERLLQLRERYGFG